MIDDPLAVACGAHVPYSGKKDVELGGKTIRAGDKVVMWYISGNRDSDAISDADQFIIDRRIRAIIYRLGMGSTAASVIASVKCN